LQHNFTAWLQHDFTAWLQHDFTAWLQHGCSMILQHGCSPGCMTAYILGLSCYNHIAAHLFSMFAA